MTARSNFGVETVRKIPVSDGIKGTTTFIVTDSSAIVPCFENCTCVTLRD